MEIEICPLCGLATHRGKCDKPTKGAWWCGLCLLATVKDDGPQLPRAILLAAGVHLTSAWCTRCGVPVCKMHHERGAAKRSPPRCVPECRTRPPRETGRLVQLLKIYVPDYLTGGPARCVVCRRPTYRRNLCSRHYNAVRLGKTELSVERLRPHKHLVPRVQIHPSLPVPVYEAAKLLADEADQAFNVWLADVIAREAIARKKKDPRAIPISVFAAAGGAKD